MSALTGIRRLREVALLSGCAAILVLSPGTAKADFVNGNFATGDLTGWSVFTTADGTNGAGLPAVVSFNTTGAGASNSAKFDVGEVISLGAQEGGGLSQVLLLGAGSYTITAAVAAQDDVTGQVNGSAGLFQILMDGTAVGSDDLGGFTSPHQIVRDTLTGGFSLATAGTHTFDFEITRPFLSGGDATPTQYITDITLGGTSSVPEPSHLGLLILAIGLTLFLRRRKQRIV
jgi:hypothetical protein